MENLKKLLQEQNDLKKQEKELENKIDLNEDEINKIFLMFHEKLFDAGFYNIKHIKYNEEINKLFKIYRNEKPYCYCGEGDYRVIKFKIKNNKLNLLFYQTYGYGDKNCFLTSIPLELFYSDENKLKKYINNLLVKNEEAIQSSKEKQKEHKKQELLKQLNDL